MNKNNTTFNNNIYINKIKDILIREGLILLKDKTEFKLFSHKDEYNLCYIVKTKHEDLFIKLTNKKTDSEIVDSVTKYLSEKGLNYAKLPKGLCPSKL